MSFTEFKSLYNKIKEQGSKDLKNQKVSDLLIQICSQGNEWLNAEATRQALTTKIPEKAYFSFIKGATVSRPVNEGLFNVQDFTKKLNILFTGTPQSLGREELQKVLYTAVMSFCAYNDLHSKGDQKTPGTFFELFSAHLMAKTYNWNPIREIEVLNLDMEGNLPTDYIFKFDAGRSSIHLPVKTSTRERVIQVWAHQRVLDGIYGVDRFKGVLVCLAETNAQPGFKVSEVCLPKQWQIYQLFISRMHRVYYLDIPVKYADLARSIPYINVKEFADFFFETDILVDPTVR